MLSKPLHQTRRSPWMVALYLLLSGFVGIAFCSFTGCERKEKVIEVETPGADVEVNRDQDTGQVEVEVER